MQGDLSFQPAKFISLRGTASRLKTRAARIARQREEVLIGHRRPVTRRKKAGVQSGQNVVEQGAEVLESTTPSA